jgi:hypothetical protein
MKGEMCVGVNFQSEIDESRNLMWVAGFCDMTRIQQFEDIMVKEFRLLLY